MFKKLKQKFIIINMSLLTFVFIAIFAVIYMLMALNGERQLAFTMDRMINAPPKPFPREPLTATSLVVELNDENKIRKVFSFITMEEEIIDEAVVKAVANNEKTGKIKVGDFHYSFLKRKFPFGTKIVFVDRRPLLESLNNILIIFIIVGVGSLVLLFVISLYWANRTIEPIKESFEKQKQFIADASHELKTPLAIIKTNLAVISHNQEETVSKQLKWLDSISSQTERISNLVKDMLTLAKMDASEDILAFENFNLTNSLEGILLSFEAILFESHINLETSLQEDIFFYGDKTAFETLINTLVDNAIKNTPKDGIISISLKTSINNIEIRIKNTGTGIAPENIDKIFQRFYREDSSRSREKGGYGLGLAIAKSIVEGHQGKIYVESNVGIYTTFIINLPKKRM